MTIVAWKHTDRWERFEFTTMQPQSSGALTAKTAAGMFYGPGLQRPCGRLLRKSSPTSARMCVMAAQTHEQSTCGFYETARPERQEETMATPCSSVFNAGYLCVFVAVFFYLFIYLFCCRRCLKHLRV